jgi:TonB family protein
MTHLGPSLRRRRRIARPWQRVVAALLVSLALNLVVLREVHLDWIGKKSFAEQVRPVELAPLSAAQWEANRGAPRSTSRLAPIVPPVVVAPKPPPQTPKPPGQVVDVAPSKNNAPPKDARFSADRDNTVEKETRSRHARAGYENTLPKPTLPAPREQRAEAPAPRKGGAASQQAVGGDGRRRGSEGKGGKADVREQRARQRLALQFDPTGQLRNRIREEHDRQAAHGGAGASEPSGQGGESGSGPRAGKPGPIDPGKLMPSASYYDRLAGGPSPDHLQDVEEGEGTYLNTREWKYATYFNRIKQSVASNWDPNHELQARDPTGNVFGYKDRVTILAVTLNEQGGLTDVLVQKTCGVDFLDRTAVEAFRKAQPFVNPPRGLVDQRGDIKFTFGFYLEFGSPGLRLFRGPAAQ